MLRKMSVSASLMLLICLLTASIAQETMAQTGNGGIPDVSWKTIETTGETLLAKQHEISAEEFIDQFLATPDSFFVVDVRDLADVAGPHIPGAHVIPYDSIYTAGVIQSLPDDKLIVVYCYRGLRSSVAWNAWTLAGKRVRSLMGGFSAWSFKVSDRPEYDQLIAGE